MRWWPVLLAACSGALPPGVPNAPYDEDGDGWTGLDGDCDDTAPDVNPDAIDWPDDDVDQDCDGDDAEALPVRALQPGDLVLTEIQKDPIGVLPTAGEWFELRNDSGEDVDLFGLLLRGEEGDEARVAASVVVEDGDHVVLGASADVVQNGEVAVDYAYGSVLRLGNASGQLEIVGETVLTALVWDPRFPDQDGRSMQLSPDAVDPSSPDAWCASQTIYGIGGWGTPGAENALCPAVTGAASLFDVAPGELVITEIMKDPLAVDGAFGEWVEIHNASGRAIDLQGLELVDEEGGGIQLLDAWVLPADGYAVFAASDDPAENGGISGVVQAWGTAYSLRNSDDTVILRYGTRQFDSVVYDNGDTFPDPTGASMQLVPGGDAATNDAGASWCVATTPYGSGDLGSPGLPNPGCP
ncbi:MAG: lamin tail domain-containing protein [Alphaproteobacteria bacterium]|nr:lamin tail domain-containing protein [Alphaproteobacteria bacterium]